MNPNFRRPGPQLRPTINHSNAINPNVMNRSNAINPNAINPNVMNPNAINPNAMNRSNAINPNAMNRSNGNTTNNRLISQFNSYANNSTRTNLHAHNNMISQNPNFSARDPQLLNRIHMAKLEQIKRAKNIEDLGMDKKQLSEYVIDPFKIQKTDKKEIEAQLNEINPEYIIDHKSKDGSNEYLRQMWKTRTNQPYKSVLKKELFDKTYKKYYKDSIFDRNISERNQLLVHKVIKKIDADKDELNSDVKNLSSNLESHNKELKTIYSTSEKNKFKKEFEYVQKYRNRLEFNPKDTEELKDYYKKEQKKIQKENKMIEELIDTLVEHNEISKEEVEELNKELSKNKQAEIEDLHSQLKRELGDDYDKIMNSIDVNEDKNDTESVVNKVTKKISIPARKKITVKASSNNPIEEKKTDDNETNNDTNNDLLEYYKNRKK